MRKKLFLTIISILLLTGCSFSKTDTLSCTYSYNSGLVTTSTKYDIDYEDDDVKKVRMTYDYMQMSVNDTDNDGKNDVPGVGTGTDGTTNDTQSNNDGIVDGVVGNAIDTIIGGVSDVILDVAGLKDRHTSVQNLYGNINGFYVQNVTDANNNYKVTYVIDFDTISDTDLATLNLSRDFETLRTNYISQGFTCK